MKTARIDVYSHGVRISAFGLRFAYVVGNYLRDNCLHTTKRRDARTKRMVTEVLNTFAAARSDYTEVYILKTQLNSFLDYAHARGYRRDGLDIVYHDPIPGIPVTFKKVWAFPWREEQTEWLDYMDPSGLSEYRQSINTAQTGQGKSAMSQEIIFRRGVRTALMLSPKYIKNWHKSLFDFYDFEEGDIIEVRGKDPKKPPHPKIPQYSMLEFQDLVSRGELDFKMVIFSINLFQRYITDYEKSNAIEPYVFHPTEFWSKCGIGLLVHDECHEFVHFLYKVKCYMNIPEVVYLSATVDSDDPFIERIYELMYPKLSRFNKGVWKKYIVSTAVTYQLKNTDKIRYKGYGGNYSHTEFEKSILKNKSIKQAYYNFIYNVICKGFMTNYREGMKMLVYCATVEMCQSLAEYLGNCWPDLKVGAYTQKEDFEDLLDNDISVTTVKSAGTGVDIPNLVFTFMTLAMGSKSGNIQVLGRLRILRGQFEGHVPEFYYLVCKSIEAHRKYHFKKVEFFSDKVLTQRILDMDFEL